MKKLISMILVLVFALTFVGCGLSTENGEGGRIPGGGSQTEGGGSFETRTPEQIFFEKDTENIPTKIVTYVYYATTIDKRPETLTGLYTTTVNGADAVMEYEYQTFADPAKEPEADFIKTVKGKIYRKDGLYSEDGVNWDATLYDAMTLEWNIDSDLFDITQISEDGFSMIAVIAADKVPELINAPMAVSDRAVLTLTSNGTAVVGAELTYTATSGANVLIKTSFSFNPQTLDFTK